MSFRTPSGIVTFTTDFGTSGSYVGAMRGATLRHGRGAQLVDITHGIPAQDIREAARVLKRACPEFPPGTVHCVVVDPGVGTNRAPVVAVAGEHVFVGPDNGVLYPVTEQLGGASSFRIATRELDLGRVSHTFHGRDIFAPVAGAIATGFAPDEVGPPMGPLIRLSEPQVVARVDALVGEIMAVDHFGNLLTNIPYRDVPDGDIRVEVGKASVTRRVTSYGHAAGAPLVILESSDGVLEVAAPGGSAADALGVSAGAEVTVRW